MHGVVEWLFLVGAGVLAGVIGTAGGITSLVAYPALLAAGLPALSANVTNSVALLGSGIGSAAQAGPDVLGHTHTLRDWLPRTVLFSLAGAVLLVLTPTGAFARIVPFLVATGSLILLAQPAVARWQVRRQHVPNRAVVGLAGAGVAMYNGYFGAGAGILLIALLLFSSEPVLYRANALKNVIFLAADVLPAVVFAVLGAVVWPAVWPLGLGALVGGLIGPRIARRVPAGVLRVLIASCGLVLAGWLFGHR